MYQIVAARMLEGDDAYVAATPMLAAHRLPSAIQTVNYYLKAVHRAAPITSETILTCKILPVLYSCTGGDPSR